MNRGFAHTTPGTMLLAASFEGSGPCSLARGNGQRYHNLADVHAKLGFPARLLFVGAAAAVAIRRLERRSLLVPGARARMLPRGG